MQLYSFGSDYKICRVDIIVDLIFTIVESCWFTLLLLCENLMSIYFCREFQILRMDIHITYEYLCCLWSFF